MSEHTVADAESVSETVHRNSWSANLEGPEHAADRDLLVEEALGAVEATAPGYHVNLVTHGEHGDPTDYLVPVLEEAFDDGVTWRYVDQCGCGGHVLRVRVVE
ncbi:CGCGG family rSAM-modified RiPP protein [Halomarina salina]|uniref:CGCGG family rSAM-modified RiPP protein n=1 Tax=Halomarina salina TaxID=1872699 RepID=A0ABD5RLM3_9EURY|nr:CGCGG family rSAM-modified RiPP protein [Halomarina salina]